MNIVIAKRIIVTLAFVALSLSIFFHNLFFNLLTEETYPDVGISSNENNLFLKRGVTNFPNYGRIMLFGHFVVLSTGNIKGSLGKIVLEIA